MALTERRKKQKTCHAFLVDLVLQFWSSTLFFFFFSALGANTWTQRHSLHINKHLDTQIITHNGCTLGNSCAKKRNDGSLIQRSMMNEEVNYIQLQQPVIVQCLRTPHTHTHKRTRIHTKNTHMLTWSPQHTHTQTNTHEHTHRVRS